jgi:hypothetical protein
MVTILILTCSNCYKTSAVQPGIEEVRSPRIETELVGLRALQYKSSLVDS